jgi:Rrf2 family nitric oxide-sensitive transcriptional repressor
MFSQTVEYALRAVVAVAGAEPGGTSTARIAALTKVPPAYLAKVVGALVRAGILTSRRGTGGGMSLARPPEGLSILDVVNAVEPIRRIRTCPLGLVGHGVNLCPLHKRVDAALASVEAAFAGTTLAEVLAEPTTSVPLCDGPGRQSLTVRPRRAVKA